MYQHFMITDVEHKLSKSLISLKNLIRKKSLSANPDKKKKTQWKNIYLYIHMYDFVKYTCMLLNIIPLEAYQKQEDFQDGVSF